MRYSKSLGCYSNWLGNFQIYEDPHELDKESGKYNKWWKDNSFMLLFG